jgi:hypothetical protein
LQDLIQQSHCFTPKYGKGDITNPVRPAVCFSCIYYKWHIFALAHCLLSVHDGRVANGSASDSSAPAKAKITFEQLHGIKQLRHVAQLLSTLHKVGCDRDKSANRELHFDDYVMLILLYLFNPMIESIALLRSVAELPELQKRLGVKRFSAGSFSESCRVFEPSKLQEVVDQLAKGLLPIERDELLKQLPGKLTLVDSSVLRTLCTVAEAIFLPLGDGRHSHA